MLSFFRRFQKGIFIAITTVIVISFSFFGSFNTYDKKTEDVEVFKAVDGTAVKRSEVEALSHFLSSDGVDQMNWGIPLGANFLNDGVIRNDFLKSGLGQLLFEEYYGDIHQEWEGKWKREKGFTPYRHPEVAYFSVDAVWTHFAPELKSAFKQYKGSDLTTPSDHFAKKAALYLAEGEFSEQKLRQVLYFQLQQAKWIKPDRNLQEMNLGLFGYRTLTDWFGQDFLRVASSFILNAAKVAERKGYKVSLDEATHDLKKRALVAFEGQKQNPMMTISEPSHYLREQLRYLGMDLSQASEVWQKVLLFRKLFNDLGSSVVVDKATFLPVVDFVAKEVEAVTYQLPSELQIKDFRQFQRFHTYLKLVGKEGGATLPSEWVTAQEAPEELLLKSYLVDIREVDHRNVSQHISLKAMWEWQVSDRGWEKLSEQFAALSGVKGESEEERFVALDQLDELTKEKVDLKTRAFIAEEHPEWIEEALAVAPFQRRLLTFYKKSSKSPLKGLVAKETALALLDAPQLDRENPPLVLLNQLGDKTWQVRILDRTPNWEVATYAEAEKEGVLEEMTVAFLQQEYNDSKPFHEVRDQIAQERFRREINRVRRSMPDASSQSVDLIATYTLFDYVNGLKERDEAEFVLKSEPVVHEALASRSSLEEQFKLVRSEAHWDRSQAALPLPFSAILAMDLNRVSQVVHKPNGDLFFYKVTGSKVAAEEELLHAMMVKSQEELASAIQIDLAKELLKEFKQKEAIKLVGFKGEKASRAV